MTGSDYYVVYKNPSDYPGKFVVRKYTGLGTAVSLPQEARSFKTLKEARAIIPAGLSCFPRNNDDDSVIVETWL